MQNYPNVIISRNINTHLMYIFINVWYNYVGDIMKIKGRPKGRNKNARLNIMIEDKIKNEYKNIAKKNGTNISVKTCELIVKYINENKEVQKNECN